MAHSIFRSFWRQTILIAAVLGLASPLAAKPAKPAKSAEKPAEVGEESPVKRVGGTYEVASIEKKAEGVFRVEFRSEAKTGRYDVLILESDHVHIGVQEGTKLRLSAEIMTENGPKAEVSQVLLFLPTEQSHVPVWMLSRKAPHAELRGSKYIDMHAPTSDYTIL